MTRWLRTVFCFDICVCSLSVYMSNLGEQCLVNPRETLMEHLSIENHSLFIPTALQQPRGAKNLRAKGWNGYHNFRSIHNLHYTFLSCCIVHSWTEHFFFLKYCFILWQRVQLPNGENKIDFWKIVKIHPKHTLYFDHDR